MKNILKSWKTNLVGLIIISGLAVNVYQNGLSIQDAIYGLLAIGFFLTKDNDQSHSNNKTDVNVPIVDPDNPKKPKKRF